MPLAGIVAEEVVRFAGKRTGRIKGRGRVAAHQRHMYSLFGLRSAGCLKHKLCPGFIEEKSVARASREKLHAWVSLALVRLERSEEHTSELQSPVHLVCRLLL